MLGMPFGKPQGAGGLGGQHDLDRLVLSGIAEHVVGIIDVAELEPVRGEPFRRDLALRYAVEQFGDGRPADQPGAQGDVVDPQVLDG